MNHALDTSAIWDVYGSRISYYTGKLEAYLRLQHIAYRIQPVGGNQQVLIKQTGASQMPIIRMADGRWMSDTTPILAWLDRKRANGPSIYPDDPTLRFVALLIEDYADEWLWRSAMHYRWSYELDRQYALEILYEEQLKNALKLPKFLGKRILKRRQFGGFVKNDGVDQASRSHADATYLQSLACLEAILSKRPFVLGERPTIADFGMMGPMFRHFGQDPTPSEIMRNKGPNVFAWVARMWGLKPADMQGDLIDGLDEPLNRFLVEISQTHLEQLRQNALAFTQAKPRFDLHVQNAVYASVPTSRYRVWCLEGLIGEWSILSTQSRAPLRDQVGGEGAGLLDDNLSFEPSRYDIEKTAPFNRAINVYEGGVPSKP